jgi:hypothetical protein
MSELCTAQVSLVVPSVGRIERNVFHVCHSVFYCIVLYCTVSVHNTD